MVTDNLPARHVQGVREAIEARACDLRYLPPSRPKPNPIETAWSNAKAHLRAITADTLASGVAAALSIVTATDCRRWFSHCG